MSKPGPKVNSDVAAQVLVDAAMLGDEAAAKRHGVSTKTVSRYREMAATDSNLSELVSLKKRAAESQWADGLALAIRGQIDFLTRASQTASPADPDVIHAVAGALKILADVALTSRMLDVRLADRDRSLREENGQDLSSGSDEDDAPATIQ